MTKTKVKLTKAQAFVLLRVCDADLRGRRWLDGSAEDRRVCRQLVRRGLIEHSGEGEGRWNVYWVPTHAGLSIMATPVRVKRKGPFVALK